MSYILPVMDLYGSVQTSLWTYDSRPSERRWHHAVVTMAIRAVLRSITGNDATDIADGTNINTNNGGR